MTSAVGICNIALSNLGDGAQVTSIDPVDGSTQAELCAVFYPVARDAVMSRYPWSFANKREALVANTTADALDAWEFAYDVPADCLRVIAVQSPADLSDRTGADFVREGDIIYTDMDEAVIRYTQQITNPIVFPALVVLAVARLLASMLSGPLVRGTEGIKVGQAHLQQYERVDLPLAMAADANTQRNSSYDDFVPSSIEARA